MNLTDTEADYLVELFTVGLEEVAERVAVITDHPVSITTPKVFTSEGVEQLAADLETDVSCPGSIAALALTGGFEGSGLMYIPSPQDEAFAEILSGHCDDQEGRDNALSELTRVLLEQYVVVMTDLLNLNIDYEDICFGHGSLANEAVLQDGCSDGSLCLSMSFVISDKDIHCHIVFIHKPPGDELMEVIKTALTNMGLAE